MAFEQEGLAVVGAERLIHPFAVQKTMIEHRHDRTLPVAYPSIHIHRRIQHLLDGAAPQTPGKR